jgi:hypothetical protein
VPSASLVHCSSERCCSRRSDDSSSPARITAQSRGSESEHAAGAVGGSQLAHTGE